MPFFYSASAFAFVCARKPKAPALFSAPAGRSFSIAPAPSTKMVPQLNTVSFAPLLRDRTGRTRPSVASDPRRASRGAGSREHPPHLRHDPIARPTVASTLGGNPLDAQDIVPRSGSLVGPLALIAQGLEERVLGSGVTLKP